MTDRVQAVAAQVEVEAQSEPMVTGTVQLATQTKEAPVGLNPDIERAIDTAGFQNFANAAFARLMQKSDEGKFGWYRFDSPRALEAGLFLNLQHGANGDDLLDAANYLMMIWNNRQSIGI